MKNGIVKGFEAISIAVAAIFYVFCAMANTYSRVNTHECVWTPVNSAYKLIFDDEFNGTSLDLSKWNPNWYGSTSMQVTQPVNPSLETATYDPAQVTVSGGYLHLKTIANPITIGTKSFPYRTGHINTNPKWGVCTTCFQINPSPGNSVYIEARIYVPSASGTVANWPAFWTTGHNWPVTGEIDIAEGLSGGMTANYHSSAGNFGSGLMTTPYTGWHVFGVLWTRSSVTYYYDGVQVQRFTTGIASAPNLVLQNAMGLWGGPTLVPVDMMVDYVHVYSTDPTVPAVTPEPNYVGPGDAGTASVADARDFRRVEAG